MTPAVLGVYQPDEINEWILYILEDSVSLSVSLQHIIKPIDQFYGEENNTKGCSIVLPSGEPRWVGNGDT